MLQTNYRQATLSHIAPQSATPSHKVQKLAIDAGNRHIKVATDYGLVEILPAYYCKANFRDDSAISYESGDRHDLTGTRWLIGDAAKARNGDATFQSEKAAIMPLMVLGILPKLGISGTVSIASLRLCLPDTFSGDSKQLIEALKGIHTINENTYHINSVKVLSEGATAYQYLLNSGTFKYAKNNGILDIGGGNCTGIICTPQGDPIWESKFTGNGAIELAKMIAQHPQLLGIESKGLSPRLDLILDAIATDHQYGVVRDISNAITDCLPEFQASLKKQLSTAWTDFLPTIGEIAIIGGCAPLMADWGAKNPRIKVLSNDAQLANVRGMLCG